MTEDTQEHRVPQNRQLNSQQHPPSLQLILSWNVTDSPKCSNHCMITVNIQSKNSEPQTTITKFNTNKANWHLFTSNETWKKVTNPVTSQSAEVLTEDFYKKKIQISAKSVIPMIEIKKAVN